MDLRNVDILAHNCTGSQHRSEDGCSKVLRNVGILPQHNTEDRGLNLHRRENLKSRMTKLYYVYSQINFPEILGLLEKGGG